MKESLIQNHSRIVFSSFICVLLTLFFFSCSKKAAPHTLPPHTHVVLVSIAPYKFFVEKIGQNTVKVLQMAPTGASPHSYEPTSRAILEGGQADIWFRMGEPFEKRALPAIQSYNSRIQSVDLREGIDPIIDADNEHHDHHHGHSHSCHHDDCRDPHVWLSPKEAAKQATLIAKTLAETYPEHKEQYQKSLKQLLKELDSLDKELTALFLPLKSQTVMVAHNAYAYLARDYGFNILPIEFEGREPSPHQLTETLEKARKHHIKTLFIQPQHLSKGAKLVARELKAKVVELDPYAESYFDNLRYISKQFASQ